MLLTDKVSQFATDSNTVHAWVNGPASGAGSSISTSAGLVRTPAKLIADNQANFDQITALVDRVKTADLAAPSGASLVGYIPDGVGAVPSTVQSKLRESVSVKDFGAVGDGVTNDSTKVQAAANEAKSKKLALKFVGEMGTNYAIDNVDVAGLDVYFDSGVSLTSPVGSTGHALVAVGTVLSRITTPTNIYNPIHTSTGTQLGLFKAVYCDDAYVSYPIGSGYPMSTISDGTPIVFSECIRPVVAGGVLNDGRVGVLFISCTQPLSINVTTQNQGRDGILFYTDPSGTTTTDAIAINCNASEFCVNSEAGRAGIHFYGVRRAKSIGCTASNDSSQINDDTAGIRFRDCEDYVADSYNVFNLRTAVLVNEVGDYAGSPHNIITRGSIGIGNINAIGKYGVLVTGTSTVECSITAARISNIADITSAAGISHGGIGSVTGCTLSDMACRGIDSLGNVSVTGNVLARCGKGGTAIPSIYVSGGSSVISGNHIFDDRGGSAIATLAIRVGGAASTTIGVNSYGVGITDFITSSVGTIIRRDSAAIRQKFGGVPSSLLGLIENGVKAVDSSGILYEYITGSWRRSSQKFLGISGVGLTQTTIAHGLGYIPTCIILTPMSDARVWESATADITNIYLMASTVVNVKICVL